MEIKFDYQFGSEEFEYFPTYERVAEFLVPVVSYFENKSMDEVQKMFEDDDFFYKKVKEFDKQLTKYLQDYAESDYQDYLDERYIDTDCEDDYCPTPASRSRNLLK